MPPADTSALTPANALGRGVMVPQSLWPAETCRENGGAGWDGVVVRVAPRTASAVVAFAHAVDERGAPYEDTRLVLSVPLPK